MYTKTSCLCTYGLIWMLVNGLHWPVIYGLLGHLLERLKENNYLNGVLSNVREVVHGVLCIMASGSPQSRRLGLDTGYTIIIRSADESSGDDLY